MTLGYATGLMSSPSSVDFTFGIALLLVLGTVGLRVLVSIYKFWGMKVKNVLQRLGVLAVVCASVIGGGCRQMVEPGHVGIVVNYNGGDRGVEGYPKVTGAVWYNPWNTRIIEYPVFVQTVVWSKSATEGNPANEEISFSVSEKMRVDADISLAYHLEAEKVPAFYVRFRAEDIKLFTHGFLRNLARQKFDDVAGKYRMDQIMGDNGPFLTEVRAKLQEELNPIGVKLDQFGFIGAPRPPAGGIDAINQSLQASQIAIRIENELRQSKAQAEKSVAQADGEARVAIARADGEAKAAIARAEGEAKANQILSNSITDNLIRWNQLDIQRRTIARWKGEVPSMMTGGAVPFINLEKKQ